jgi:HAD superfamily hydrolase (TIGR01509 family)
MIAVRPRLVIFDCDGVLIDSEALCDRVVSAVLTEDGWAVSPEDCHRLFLGLAFADIQVAAEAHLGRSFGVDWVDRVVARVTAVMATESTPIPGARQALEATTAMGLEWRIGSNSSRVEMAAKFARTGLADLTEGRIHSAYDLIAEGLPGKPAPHLFIRAAAEAGVAPSLCLVVEDSLPGVRAAVAAGMRCLAYCPDHDGAAHREAGALPFPSMFGLPDLLRGYLDLDP